MNEDIVTHITRLMAEGEEIIKNDRIRNQERLSIQAEKDKEYNIEHVSTTDNEWKMRVDRTGYRGSNDPTWWYIPTKDLSGCKFNSYAKWFWCDIGWFHEVWEKWFDMPYSGMLSVSISKVTKKGYFPVKYKYVESKYNDGSHWTWNLKHYVSNDGHIFFSRWVGVSQGMREFIRFDMDYSPENYPNEKEFVLWFKIKAIKPSRY